MALFTYNSNPDDEAVPNPTHLPIQSIFERVLGGTYQAGPGSSQGARNKLRILEFFRERCVLI